MYTAGTGLIHCKMSNLHKHAATYKMMNVQNHMK